MSNAELIYEESLAASSDVKEHLPILRVHAEYSKRVIELGFRGGVSTAALVAAKPKRIWIYDWDKAPFNIDQKRLHDLQMAGHDNGTEISFTAADSLSVDLPEADMLFLDTFHTYEHLFLELIQHSDSIQKFMLIHDTDETSCPGMFNAVEDFLLDNKQWHLSHRLRKRPGLTVLERTAGWPTFSYSRAFTATLLTEVRRQKEIFYDSVGNGGSRNPEWSRYLLRQAMRFGDVRRWPLTNERRSATELVAGEETMSPRTDS